MFTRNQKSDLLLCLISSVAVFMVAGSSPVLAQSNEIIVDNSDGNTAKIGRWKTSGGIEPYGTDSLYNLDTTGRFYWYPELPEPGKYYVFAYWTYMIKRSDEVPYYIAHTKGTAKVVVNMRNKYFASRWNLLGQFEFAAGPNEIWVSGENGQASADAIKLIPADGWAPSGEILGYYSATAEYDVVAPGDYGGVKSSCALGDYAVSGSYYVRPDVIYADTSKFYFRITEFHLVVDGATGVESWALGGQNESSLPIDAKIGVSARCADVGE
jgi:hypothetical protein